ncbi:hypothetical protein M3172_04065 [Mesobacillus subterraneus]|uniref:hypothetical protein n=1 Tax=Mesobacillus subterraneus TaxID=285983 RepID=UPI0020417974|nr:hypothetical protein [Mesobacillus subterraneus]MCM3572351.1 hypothetical protein [Mesobacillus subterraneus]
MNYRLTLSLSLLLSCVLLFVTGCFATDKPLSKDPNITALQTVLEHQFTGPDPEFIEGSDNIEKLEQYYEKRYKPYFTEERYNSFISTSAYQYILVALNNDKQIKMDKVKVEKDEDTYTFKMTVLYGKEESSQNSAEVTGRAKFNNEGKITSIQYLNDDGLSEKLSN